MRHPARMNSSTDRLASPLFLVAAMAATACSGSVSINGGSGAGGHDVTIVHVTAAQASASSGDAASVGGAGGSVGTGGDDATSSVGVGGVNTSAGVGGVDTSVGVGGDPTVCDPANLDHDSNNCGACGHSCLGGDCKAAMCQSTILMYDGGQPWDIGLYGNDVYWLNTDGRVQRITKQGSDLKLYAFSLIDPFALKVDGGGVFWSYYVGGISVEGRPLEGGVTTVYGALDLAAGVLGLDDKYVYWSSVNPAQTVATLMKTPRAGGPQTPVFPAPIQTGYIGSDAGYLYWIDGSTPGGLRRALTDTGPVENLVDGPEMYNIAFDQDHVYWVYAGTYVNGSWVGTEIRRVLKTGGAPETVVKIPTFANSIAVDGTDVYWASYDGLSINRVNKQGGPIVKLAYAANPRALAIDDEAVYWVEPTGGVLGKIAK